MHYVLNGKAELVIWSRWGLWVFLCGLRPRLSKLKGKGILEASGGLGGCWQPCSGSPKLAAQPWLWVILNPIAHGVILVLGHHKPRQSKSGTSGWKNNGKFTIFVVLLVSGISLQKCLIGRGCVQIAELAKMDKNAETPWFWKQMRWAQLLLGDNTGQGSSRKAAGCTQPLCCSAAGGLPPLTFPIWTQKSNVCSN